MESPVVLFMRKNRRNRRGGEKRRLGRSLANKFRSGSFGAAYTRRNFALPAPLSAGQVYAASTSLRYKYLALESAVSPKKDYGGW